MEQILKDENDQSTMNRKMMETMHADFFSGTFYAMRNKFKKKYKLLTSDQADYFMESLFLIVI